MQQMMVEMLFPVGLLSHARLQGGLGGFLVEVINKLFSYMCSTNYQQNRQCTNMETAGGQKESFLLDHTADFYIPLKISTIFN